MATVSVTTGETKNWETRIPQTVDWECTFLKGTSGEIVRNGSFTISSDETGLGEIKCWGEAGPSLETGFFQIKDGTGTLRVDEETGTTTFGMTVEGYITFNGEHKIKFYSTSWGLVKKIYYRNGSNWQEVKGLHILEGGNWVKKY